MAKGADPADLALKDVAKRDHRAVAKERVVAEEVARPKALKAAEKKARPNAKNAARVASATRTRRSNT